MPRSERRWFRGPYFERHDRPIPPGVTPLEAQDVSRLPPATVAAAEFGPLRDEGRAYVERMGAAGVDVIRRHDDGMIGGVFGILGPSTSAGRIGAVNEHFREVMVGG